MEPNAIEPKPSPPPVGALVEALSPIAFFLVEELSEAEDPTYPEWSLRSLYHGLYRRPAGSVRREQEPTASGESETETETATAEDDPFLPLGELVEAGLAEVTEDEDGDLAVTPGPRLPEARDAIAARLPQEQAVNRSALIAGVCERLGVGDDDPLRRALAEVDRADFVPAPLRRWAVVDRPVPVPVPVHGHMTESALHAVLMTLPAARPAPGQRVLVCGTKHLEVKLPALGLVGTPEDVPAYVREVLERSHPGVHIDA